MVRRQRRWCCASRIRRMFRSFALALIAALPIIAAEVPVATPHSGGSSELNIVPVVASNGSTFAVAWNGDTPHVAIYDGRGNVIARVERVTKEQALVQDIAAIGRDYVL